MRTYGQYCPIARGSEIFAERWTPLIIRNLHLGCETFGEILEGAPGLSHTLLTQRLKQLERLGIVESGPKAQGRGHRYQLSDSGHDLFNVCQILGEWGARWLEIAPENLDPFVALWSMCNALRGEQLPARRVVIRFDFTGFRPHERYWLLLEHGEVEICKTYPGLDEDLYITADAEAFVKWHAGQLSWTEATRDSRSSSTGRHGSYGPSRPGRAAACSLTSRPPPVQPPRTETPPRHRAAASGRQEPPPCFAGFLVAEFADVAGFVDVRRPHVEAFKLFYVARLTAAGKLPARNTIRQRFGMLRSFFDRIIEWDWPDAPQRIPIFSVDVPVADDPLPRFLDDAQAARLAAQATVAAPFDRLIIELLSRTGMRVGELCTLEVDAVVELNGTPWLRIPVGKLHNDRYVPLHPNAARLLAEWTAVASTRRRPAADGQRTPTRPPSRVAQRAPCRYRRWARPRPPPPTAPHVGDPGNQPRHAPRSDRHHARTSQPAHDTHLRPHRQQDRRRRIRLRLGQDRRPLHRHRSRATTTTTRRRTPPNARQRLVQSGPSPPTASTRRSAKAAATTRPPSSSSRPCEPKPTTPNAIISPSAQRSTTTSSPASTQTPAEPPITGITRTDHRNNPTQS